MKRTGLAGWILLLVFSSGLSIWAGEPNVEQLIKELKGEAPAKKRTKPLLEAAHVAALKALLPGLASDNPDERQQAQRAYKAICWHAGRPGAEAERAAVSKVVLGKLSTKLPKPTLIFLLEVLEYTGRDEAVDALARLLDHRNPKPPFIRERARKALVRNPSPKAVDALREALGRAKEPRWKIGLINALGARRDKKAVPALLKLARSKDEAVHTAAIEALARIGDKAAAELIASASKDASPRAWRAAIVSYLLLADRLVEQDDKATALEMYRNLLDAEGYVKAGALIGVGRAGGADELPVIFKALADKDVAIRAAAMAALDLMPVEHVREAVAKEAKTGTPEMKVLLLKLLAKRGERSALPSLIAAAKDADESVRIAAFEGMGKLRDERAIPTLLGALAKTKGRELDAVKATINHIPGKAATDALVKAMPGAGPHLRVEIVRVLAARKDEAAAPALLEAAADKNADIRVAAFKALGGYAGEKALAPLVGLLVKARGDDDRRAAKDAVLAVCGRIEDRERRAQPVLAALPKADVPARCSLLRVLARTGAEKALSALRAARRDANAQVQDAAVRGLADWPDARAAGDLLKIAQSSRGVAHHVLALRGYVRVVGLPSARSASATLRMYAAAMKVARRANEKKEILAAVAKVRDLGALKQVEPYLADEALKGEAAVAAVEIASAISGSHRDEAMAALKKLLETAPNKSVRKQAQQAINQIERFEDYITAWEVSGPYTKRGKGGPALHDVPFPPEQRDDKASKWKLMPAGADPKQPWAMDLGKVLGGENRVAYLRTRVWSPKEQQVRLEFGSDDGAKVWLNGKLVISHRQPRSLGPGADKRNVTVKEGWNTLLVKVWNAGSDWGACARFRKPDGSKLEGLRASVRTESKEREIK